MKHPLEHQIKHVVVLMMENRSFDHLFGDFPGVNGITPGLYNLQDPTETTSNRYTPNRITVTTQPSFSPGHTFGCMMHDIFGPNAIGWAKGNVIWSPVTPQPVPQCYPSKMTGFISTNGTNTADGVMSYFQYLQAGEPGRLNVLHTLAEHFVLCDNWYCETPSETVPNRHFMHAATNMGYNDTDAWPGKETAPHSGSNEEPKLYDAKTIYKQLDTLSSDPKATNWAMYGFPQDEYDSGMYAYTAAKPQANRSIFDFPVDVLTGNLPFYNFIMPSLLFSTGEHEGSANGNSMHPCSDIRLGENLIASVYNVLRNSPIWEETLLIVTFDENGGVYDHVLPPAVCAPDSYGYYSNKKLLFDYTMLGPRIPALLISPWLEKGVVDSTQYRNTSILRFVQDLFAAQNQVAEAPSLTQRDLNANSIALSAWRTTPHEHCPAFIKPHVGFANWGTEMTDPNGDDPYSGPNIPWVTQPVPTVALDFAKAYCSQYPGHPDSGKPLEQLFKSQSEMLRYMTERRHAARKFYRDHR